MKRGHCCQKKEVCKKGGLAADEYFNLNISICQHAANNAKAWIEPPKAPGFSWDKQ